MELSTPLQLKQGASGTAARSGRDVLKGCLPLPAPSWPAQPALSSADGLFICVPGTRKVVLVAKVPILIVDDEPPEAQHPQPQPSSTAPPTSPGRRLSACTSSLPTSPRAPRGTSATTAVQQGPAVAAAEDPDSAERQHGVWRTRHSINARRKRVNRAWLEQPKPGGPAGFCNGDFARLRWTGGSAAAVRVVAPKRAAQSWNMRRCKVRTRGGFGGGGGVGGDVRACTLGPCVASVEASALKHA